MAIGFEVRNHTHAPNGEPDVMFTIQVLTARESWAGVDVDAAQAALTAAYAAAFDQLSTRIEGVDVAGGHGLARVERADGKPLGRVFVLAYERRPRFVRQVPTDPFAVIALAAYAAACRKIARLGLMTAGPVTQARSDPGENGIAIGDE